MELSEVKLTREKKSYLRSNIFSSLHFGYYSFLLFVVYGSFRVVVVGYEVWSVVLWILSLVSCHFTSSFVVFFFIIVVYDLECCFQVILSSPSFLCLFVSPYVVINSTIIFFNSLLFIIFYFMLLVVVSPITVVLPVIVVFMFTVLSTTD